MVKNKYDCVVIGTSPLMLIEALYNSKLGKSVIVIEGKEIIGGSWHCFDQNEIANNLEIGCHVWQKNTEVTKFLKDYFAIDIEPRFPQPKSIFYGIKLPYYFIYLFLIFRKINFKSLFKLNHLALYKSLAFDFFKELFNRSKYYYPENGSSELISKILKKINDSSISLISGNQALSIDLNSMTLSLKDENVINFNEIIATNKLDIDQIILPNNDVFKIKKRESVIHNLYLVIENSPKTTLSYAETFGDSVIYRLSDMTYPDSTLSENGLRLLCADIFPATFHKYSQEEIKTLVITRLIKWKIINDNSVVVNHYLNSYKYNGQGNETIPLFNSKMNPKIVFLKSNNLIPSLADNIERWKTKLK